MIIEKEDNVCYDLDLAGILAISLFIPIILIPLVILGGIPYYIAKIIKNEFDKVK
jgi:hypothetical protein